MPAVIGGINTGNVPSYKWCSGCQAFLPVGKFRHPGVCLACRRVQNAAVVRARHALFRANPDMERAARWRAYNMAWRHTPKGRAMRQREYANMRADPDKVNAQRERVRRADYVRRAIYRLMFDLSGACWPRPWCPGECMTTHYDSGKRKRAPHRLKWCQTCATITGDVICMCCFHKTRNLQNVAAWKRKQWEYASQHEIAVMLRALFPLEEWGGVRESLRGRRRRKNRGL